MLERFRPDEPLVCFRIGWLAILFLGLFPSICAAQSGTLNEIGWFSEEQPAAACWPGYAVAGLRCSGRYCDDKKLICRRYTSSTDRVRFEWTPWFSEEGNSRFSSVRGFISGMACSGSYCDNIMVRFFYSAELRNTGRCMDLASISEENGGEGTNSAECPEGQFVAGVTCSGAYCDNLQLTCCTHD